MQPSSRFFACVLATLVLGSAPVHAVNAPTLVRDINTVPIGVSSGATYLGTLNGSDYFAADDGTHGAELWKSNGTRAGTSLVKDINPGSAASSPANFKVAGGLGYFTATTPASGREVWVTDGTAQGTRLLADLEPGVNASDAFPAGALGSKMLISGMAGNSYVMWASDGTTQGTVRLSGSTGFSLSTFSPVGFASNGKAYFDSMVGNDDQLWVTDGTPAGSHALGPVPNGAVLGGTAFVQAGAYLYFLSSTTAGGGALFRVRLADDVVQQVITNVQPANQGTSPYDTEMVALGNVVFFIGTSGGVTQVWRSDGSTGGTYALAGFDYRVGNSQVSSHLSVAGNRVFFLSGTGSGATVEAYSTDGTVAGTINLSQQVGLPGSFLGVGGSLAFYGPTGGLWRSDGTIAGTRAITTLGGLQLAGSNRIHFAPDAGIVYLGLVAYPGSDTSAPSVTFRYDPAADSAIVLRRTATQPGDLFAASSGRLYFSDVTPTLGDEPWVSDGTVAGTHLLADIAPEPAQAGSNPDNFYAFQGKLYFSASDGITGHELWRSDGTAAGTVLAADIVPGPLDAAPNRLFGAGNALMFFAYDSQASSTYLYRFDPATTALDKFNLVNAPAFCDDFRPTTVQGITYFGAAFGSLLRTDGSVANTAPVFSAPNRFNYSGPCVFQSLNERAYFFAADSGGFGLWSSDGTEAGTLRVISLGSSLGNASVPQFLTTYAGALYFLGPDVAGNTALYKSDGTAANTAVVAAVPARLDVLLGVVNNRLLFGSQQYTANAGLWSFDAATATFTAITGPRFAVAGPRADDGSRVFFTGTDAANGIAPWTTDGTIAGTRRLADAAGRTAGELISWLGGFHRSAVFTDTDNEGERHLWTSDGTTAGTHVVSTLGASQYVTSTHPAGLTVGSKFYFALSDPVVGSELYALSQTLGASSTALTPSLTSIAVGAPLDLSAVVQASAGAATPTGSVVFMDDATALGTVSLDGHGAATLSTTALAAGNHPLTAVYSGDGVYAASTSAVATVTVTQTPTVTLSVSPATLTLGQSATLTWTSTGATGCTASDAWSGTQPISGSLSVTPAGAGTLNYVLSCAAGTPSAQATAVLTVTAPATGGSSGGGGSLALWELMALGVLAGSRRLRANAKDCAR